MKGKLLRIVQNYMMELYSEENDGEYLLKDFNEYEASHIDYVYKEYAEGSTIYASITALVDDEIEFECSGCLVR